jgi:hypothetical protein
MPVNVQLRLAWSQISVFDANLSDPFNGWNEIHLRQGFAWRVGSVSFKTPLRHGTIDVKIDMPMNPLVQPDASRAIIVPFTTWAGLVEISTIESRELIEIPPGRYALLYQHGSDGSSSWCSLDFIPSAHQPVEPEILRGTDDDGPVELLMEAEPAA